MSERRTFFVDVILPVPVNQLFTYRVPHELSDFIKFGIRVIVPFGRAKLISGIIVNIHEQAPTKYTAKYLEHILDEEPIIQSFQYKFWCWISEYYMAPLGDVMNAALPSNFKLASETKISLHPDFDKNEANLSDKEYMLIEALEIQEILDLSEISEILNIKTVQPIIKKLIEKRCVITLEDLRDKYAPRKAVHIALNSFYCENDNLNALLTDFESQARGQKQLDALLIYLKEAGQAGNLVLKKTLESEGASSGAIQSLEKKEIFISKRIDISRLAEADGYHGNFKELSEAQQTALDSVRENFKTKKVNLLFGVTGSGKTEVYVELIREQLKAGKQVLFLLPEIALTTQLIQRLNAYFGELVGVYHSKFNQNERVEIWNALLTNDPNRFRIVLGARSAIFLPFTDLGLIIVDEEHETSFKQFDPSPRYNARDAAILLGHMVGAPVLLGSATPSFESFWNARQGKYGFSELTTRFGNIMLPEILCADVKKERQEKTINGHFTKYLLEHIEHNLKNDKQIILFQNRRGYTPYWMCELCNWIPECKNCDVSLTYHKQSNSLKCHYCSYVTAPVGSCANCGSNRLSMLGFGTEKIEDDLSLLFPDIRIARMDMDSTRTKNAYENIINDFEQKKIHILIGTQMVSKGLDFDNVGLVGILDADMLLKRSDFRAVERAYQLMSQVAGRAGRKKERGKVVIQTATPENWVIQKVIEHDFPGFYESEILERKNYFYPPFYKIIDITLKHKDKDLLIAASQQLADAMIVVFRERVLGPEFPVIPRIQNYFIKQIKLKIEREAPEKKVKERLREIVDHFYSAPLNKSIRISINIDPA